MPGVNVQFRADPETAAFLRERGVTPSQFAKEAFEREVRRLRAEAHAGTLAKLGVKLPKGEAERAVRQARDER